MPVCLFREGNGRDVAIQELDGDQTDSDDSIGADANDLMAAAGLQVSRVHADHDTFIAALNNMVSCCPHSTCCHWITKIN